MAEEHFLPLTNGVLLLHEVNSARTELNTCSACGKILLSSRVEDWKRHVRSSTHKWLLNKTAGRRAVLALGETLRSNLESHLQVARWYESSGLVKPFIQVQVYLLSGEVCYQTDVAMDSWGARDLVRLLAKYLKVSLEVFQLRFSGAPHCVLSQEAWMIRTNLTDTGVKMILANRDTCKICGRERPMTTKRKLSVCTVCNKIACSFCLNTYNDYQ